MTFNSQKPKAKSQWQIAIIVALSLSLGMKAQSAYTISLTSGWTIPNSSEFSYISDVSAGIDAAVMWSRGCSATCYRPYNIGLRANYSHSANPIAGQRIGLAGFVLDPIYTFHNLNREGNVLSGQLDLDMACGLSFYTNPYCLSGDERNLFIGSYTNCLIQVGLSYSLFLPRDRDLVFAAKLVHASNGYIKKPNKGLNYLQGEIGYRFGSVRCEPTAENLRAESEEPTANGQLIVSYASGIVMPRYTGASANYFYAYTARLGYIQYFNSIRGAGVTLDMTYNCSHDALRKHNHDTYSLPFYLGLCANYETNFDKLTLHVGLAAYLLRSHYGTTPLYERVGVFYNFGKGSKLGHFVGVSLKSHMAHIDFIEWHYGIKLKVNSTH